VPATPACRKTYPVCAVSLVRQLRRIRKPRIAQSDHQVVAVPCLRLLFPLQRQLKDSGGRVHLQDRRIKWRAEEQPIQGEEAQEGKEQRQDGAATRLVHEGIHNRILPFAWLVE
jgi:hypothetical protein